MAALPYLHTVVSRTGVAFMVLSALSGLCGKVEIAKLILPGGWINGWKISIIYPILMGKIGV